MLVVPLICEVAPTVTDDKAELVKVATSADTLVPNGTVTAMFAPVITPVTARLAKLNVVISFALLPSITVTV